MGNIEHLPERLAVMAWDRHATPMACAAPATWRYAKVRSSTSAPTYTGGP
jgi:hypothetical protein